MKAQAIKETRVPPKQHIRRRKGLVRIEVQQNGRAVSEAQAATVLADVNRRFVQQQEQERQNLLAKRLERIERLPSERQPIERAMLAVEDRIVKGMWVLQRSVTADRPGDSASGWPPYMIEELDRYGQALEAGGWIVPAPRPALPSSKEIDAATEAQGWLEHIDETERKVLVLGAMTKRGETGRRIDWERVRPRLSQFQGNSTRWFGFTYTSALRNIVLALTAEQFELRSAA